MSKRLPASRQWFVAEEVPEDSLYMMGPPTRFMTQEWSRLGFVPPGFRREPPFFINFFQGDFCQMWFRRGTFDRGSKFLATKMLARPGWALSILDRVEDWSQKLFDDGRWFRSLRFRTMTPRAMVRAFNRVYRWQALSNGIGASISWYSDAEGEHFSRGISAMIDRRLKKTSLTDSTSTVFSTLSTPRAPSHAAIEECEFLSLAAALQRRTRIRRLFRQLTLRQLPAAIAEADLRFSRRLKAHCERWRWLRYGYRGPAYADSYFFSRWQALAKSGEHPRDLLRALGARGRDLARRQRILIRRLRFSARERQRITLAQRIVFIKEFRKGALYHGLYCFEPFFREVARRLCVRLEHVWAMNPWEITAALERGRVGRRELAARLTFAVSYATHTGYRVLSGEKARRFMARLPKEAVVHEGITELTGTCASPGRAAGAVRIVNVQGDMPKMRPGDVLISETTYPSLLPAMKKAAAIVTNVGGLTCHAAIVSRELGIPCVVGTKIATKVLKDGDRVEVDATKGTVRRVS